MLKLTEIGKAIATGVTVRIGTAFSIWLLAHGVPEDLAEQAVQAVAVVIAFAIDLGLAYLLRGRGVR